MSFLLFLSSSLYAEPLSLQTDQALAVHLSTYGLDRIEEAVIRHLANRGNHCRWWKLFGVFIR